MTPDELDRILMCLQSKLCGEVIDLQLTTTERGLRLQGRATCYYAKQVAQQLVMTETPLLLLTNDIVVFAS